MVFLWNTLSISHFVERDGKIFPFFVLFGFGRVVVLGNSIFAIQFVTYWCFFSPITYLTSTHADRTRPFSSPHCYIFLEIRRYNYRIDFCIGIRDGIYGLALLVNSIYQTIYPHLFPSITAFL